MACSARGKGQRRIRADPLGSYEAAILKANRTCDGLDRVEARTLPGSRNNGRRRVRFLGTNEANFIELTIKSVVAQSARPIKWVIVSDGSTDGTDDIVEKYAANHSWMELVRLPERRERHFAGKVQAFNAGYARVRGLPYEIIGNLDADVSFD